MLHVTVHNMRFSEFRWIHVPSGFLARKNALAATSSPHERSDLRELQSNDGPGYRDAHPGDACCTSPYIACASASSVGSMCRPVFWRARMLWRQRVARMSAAICGSCNRTMVPDIATLIWATLALQSHRQRVAMCRAIVRNCVHEGERHHQPSRPKLEERSECVIHIASILSDMTPATRAVVKRGGSQR